MKIIKKFYLFIFLSLLAIFTIPTSSVKATNKVDNGYYIENYDIKIDVKENNVLDITETIEVNFLEKRHGIYRVIPTISHTSEGDRYSQIYNYNVVGGRFDSYYDESRNLVLKIGSESSQYIGKYKYNIEYTYNLGEDTYDGYDLLYLNLVGYNWTTNINKVHAIIFMPNNNYDINKMIYSKGSMGSTSTNGIEVKKVDKVIEINSDKLNAYESLTIRLPLQDNYFKNTSKNIEYPYYFDSIDRQIKVNENNTFDVVDKVSVVFNNEDYYSFEYNFNPTYVIDGKTKYGVVSNIESSINFIDHSLNVYKNNNAPITLLGLNDSNSEFIVKYTINFGKDIYKGFDKIHFKLVNETCSNPITHLSVKMELPKAFNASLIDVSDNYKTYKYGDVSNTINVSDNIISYNNDYQIVKFNKKNRGDIFLNVELSDNYFENAFYYKNTFLDYFLNIIAPIILVLITALIWFKYGKDDLTVEVVTFKPPLGLNSLDVGYIYKGKVDKKDIISLIVYLANKQYLKIENFKNDNFRLIKLKDYDGNDSREEKLFNTIFTNGNEVSKQELMYNKRLLDTFEFIENKTKNGKILNKFKLYDPYSEGVTWVLYAFIALIPIMCFGFSMGRYTNIYPNVSLWTSLIFSVILLFVIIPCLLSKRKNNILSFIISSIITILPMTFMVIYTFNILYPLYNLLLPGLIIGCLSIVAIVIFLYIMPKRTKQANKLYGEILGFRKFIDTAEKDRIEMLIKDDPKYFYDVIPYAYVLGVSDKWINQFSYLVKDYNDMDFIIDIAVISSLNTILDSVTHTLDTSSMGSSGGFSGGIGSSGGGIGGGGGGSW